MEIFCANLAWALRDEDLLRLFAPFGEVLSARIATDRQTGQSKGFGFVEMADPNAAILAIESLNCYPVHGREIVVRESVPREERAMAGHR